MSFVNIPNFLTLLRIALIPFFTLFYLNRAYDLAFAFFLIAGLTDFLDGLIARGFNRKTAVGAFLDPAADKLLMNTCFVIFYLMGAVPFWLTALVFGRDLLIVSGLGYIKVRGVSLTFSPTRLSKINTLLQLLVLFLIFLAAALTSPEGWLHFPAGGAWLDRHFRWLFLATGLMTILTGIQYTVIGLGLLRSRDGAVSAKKTQTGGQ